MKVIDYEETMKCLDEVEDCEDKTYAKSLVEWAINKRTFEAVPLSVIEDIKHEAKMKATTEEVLDEDLYKSSLNEDTSCDCAMDESIVETEVIILDKLFEIIDKAVKEVEKNDDTRGISRFKQFT